MWIWWIVGLLAALGLSITWGARHTALRAGDTAVEWLGRALPIASITACAAVFTLTGGRGSFTGTLALWMHHAAIALLFIFLVVGQYLQLEGWWKQRTGAGRASIAETYRHFWTLTELVPAPTAIVILATGLRLIWEVPVNSPSKLWLLLLIVGFALFFFDGLLGYLPIARRWHRHWGDGAGLAPDDGPKAHERLQLFLHFVSFPFVFVLGVYRWNPTTWLTREVGRLEGALDNLGAGLPEVLVAFALFCGIGGAVGVGRSGCSTLARRLTRRSKSS